MAVSAGTAYLDIAPRLTKDFSKQIFAEIRRSAAQIERRGGGIEIKPNTSKFTSDLLSKVAPALKRVGLAATAALGAFAAGGAVAAVAGMKSTISAASDLNETVSKTRVIFGRSAKEIERWARGSARNIGLSRQEALSAASGFGDMFHQLGIGLPRATKMSKAMVDLSADFASFHNADISEVLEAQSAAFRGEFDSIQKFIPAINAARVEQVALSLSHKKNAKDLTDAEKAMAVYQIMLKDTAAAQGDFARTSNGAANQQRILTAQTKDLQASIGQALLPTYNKLLVIINDKIIPAAKSWWSEHGPKFREAFSKAGNILTEKVVPALNTAWHWLAEELWPALKEGADLIEQRIVPNLDKMKQGWNDNSEAINRFLADVKPLTDKVFPFIAWILDKTTEEINGLITQIGWLARAWQVIRKPVLFVIESITNYFLFHTEQIFRAANAAFSWIPGLGPKIRLARDQFVQFRKDVNAEFKRIEDEQVRITASPAFTFSKTFTQDDWLAARQAADRMHTGGRVGGRPAGRDSQLRWLDPDEHVWTGAEVVAAGGHAAMERWRKAVLRGDAPLGLAGGGPVLRTRIGALPPEIGQLPSARHGIASLMGDWGGKLLVAALKKLTPGAIPHTPGSWKLATDYLSRIGVPYSIISTFRPGARTHATGAVSYHALNRAVDLDGGHDKLRIFRALERTNPTELIYSRAPRYKSRSGWHPISRLDPITRADHFTHLHAAYDRGGWLMPGWTMAYNGTGLPEPVGATATRPGAGAAPAQSFVVNIINPRGGVDEIEQAARRGIAAALAERDRRERAGARR